jgi:hypothetical protein
MPLSKSFAREPADFYGLPVAFLQTPSDERVSKMGPTTRTIRPASGSCCRGQAEPVSIDDRSITKRASRPILPWAFVVFSRVCRMLFLSTRFCTGSSSSRLNAANRRSRAFRGLPSAHGFRGRLLQGSALGLLHSYDRARGDIPAVAGPSACSGDLRLVDPSDLEAVTTDYGDVLPFRIDIPSEVSAPSGGAL